jgi:RNA polymerase sigma factor (sigma-70 family)
VDNAPGSKKGSAMAGQFATTRWSMVLAADGMSPDSGRALTWLCQTYWRPVYEFVRRRGHSPELALDLTQEFFTRRIERCDVSRVDPERSRFRNWLLGAVKHFLANAYDHETAWKRDRRSLVWLDGLAAEERYRLERSDALDAEQLYHRSYVLTVLERCLERLQAECVERGKGPLFAQMKPWLYGEPDRACYATLAASLAISEGNVKVQLHRLRRRWSALVREEVAELVEKPEDVTDELRSLSRALRDRH